VLGLERDDARMRHLEPEQLKRQIFMATRALVERRLATGPLDTVALAVKRAVDAGAKLTMPLADMFWGDRHGQVIDPFGHRWGISQHLHDVPSEEIARAAAEMFGGQPG